MTMPLCSGSVARTGAQAPPCVLHIALASPVSSASSAGLRSSLWGSASSVQLSSKDGRVSLLLHASELSKNLERTWGRRMIGGIARSYMENKNPVFQFLNKLQGSLPLVSLVARILNPEGGVGNDRIRLEEFCTRVERRSTREAARAFYEFSDRHGKVAKPQFVLIWCWAAALGAGLLRSDDLIMGASRLRVSYDIQYEVENFEVLMEEALKKRDKSGSPVPDVPIELRAEKALEAILQCCTGRLDIEEEDAPLLATILTTVFPTADVGQIDLAIQSRMFDPNNVSSNSRTASLSDENASDKSSEQESELGEEQTLGQPETLFSEL